MIPRQRGEPRPQRENKFWNDNRWYWSLKSGAWPQVDETAELVAAMTADTVLQILRGHGHYYGLGAEQRDYINEPTSERRTFRPTRAAFQRKRRGREINDYIAACAIAVDNEPDMFFQGPSVRTLTERELVELMFD